MEEGKAAQKDWRSEITPSQVKSGEPYPAGDCSSGQQLKERTSFAELWVVNVVGIGERRERAKAVLGVTRQTVTQLLL